MQAGKGWDQVEYGDAQRGQTSVVAVQESRPQEVCISGGFLIMNMTQKGGSPPKTPASPASSAEASSQRHLNDLCCECLEHLFMSDSVHKNMCCSTSVWKP